MIKTKSKRPKHRQTLKHKHYLNKLKKIYPETKYDNSTIDHDIYNTTYGEMAYDGMNNMINGLLDHNVNQCKNFVDLGSGRGSICLYMASKPNIKNSIGVELIKDRFDDAIELKNKLGKNKYTSKLQFYNNDMFDFLKNEPIDKNPYLVWISNLLFSQDLTNKIYDQLITKLPNKSIICSSNNPTQYDETQCKSIKDISVPMSWSDNSTIHAYQIQK
jgi:hypothetical protein